MSVKVKYHLFEENTIPIKNLSLSQDYMAFSTGLEDNWLSLMKMTVNPKTIQFDKGLVPSFSRRAISYLQWSPSGELLASAFDRLTIWELRRDDSALRKLCEFHDHKLEITALAWSPDNKRIGTCSLDSKVVIVDIPSRSKILEIDCGNKAVGISWDPFDKYLAVLRFDNQIMVWRVANWEQFVIVDLNFTSLSKVDKHTSKREDRKIDWSPDYRYLLVPSLDDRNVPVVCALDRTQKFQVTKNFIGPFSSVNVVKFSPILFRTFEDQNISTAFAMGDNDGNISVWVLSQKAPDRPLFLLKNTAGELIEDISWSADGSVMIATTMKKYVIMIMININEVFGQVLDSTQRGAYLDQTFTDIDNSSPSQNFNGVQVNVRHFQPKQISVEQMDLKPSTSRMESYASQKDNQQFTQQQTIMMNGRKKIIPRMQIAQSQSSLQEKLEKYSDIPSVVQQSQIESQNISVKPKKILQKSTQKCGLPIMLISKPNVITSYSYQMLLQGDQVKCQLSFEHLNTQTIIKCKNGDTIEWADQVEGQVLLIQSNTKLICMFTDRGFLYLDSYFGKRLFPPIVIPNICHLFLTEENQLLLLSEQGEFQILEVSKGIVLMQGNIKPLMQIVLNDLRGQLAEDEQNGIRSFDPVQSIYLVKNIQGGVLPQILMKNQTMYVYSENLKLWTKAFQLYQGENQESCQNLANFYENRLDLAKVFNYFQNTFQQKDSFFQKFVMNDPNELIDEGVSNIQQIAWFEEQLLLLVQQMEGEALLKVSLKYIDKLCNCLPMNGEKLKQFLQRLVGPTNQEQEVLQRAKIALQDVKQDIYHILIQTEKAQEYIEYI